jgi:hypothetical protein
MPEMFRDPEPLDEDDPEVKEEMFELYESLGYAPDSLTTATDAERKEYGDWLLKAEDRVPGNVPN